MHLSSDATIAREGAGRTPFLSAKGREGARRKPFFVHGGPRRGTENILDPSCPRRGRENRANASKIGRHNSPRRGRKNTFFVREGARRGAKKTFFCPRRGTENILDPSCPRRGRENRAIASKFGRHNSPRRAPTRGAPTDSGSLKWVCPNLMQLPWEQDFRDGRGFSG